MPLPPPSNRRSPSTAHQIYLADLQSLTTNNTMPQDKKERPAFNFVTRTHPDQFRDDEARQNVRSHVMRDYRRKNSPANSGKKPARSRSKAGQGNAREQTSRPTPGRSESFTTAGSVSPIDPAFTIPSSMPSNAEWGEEVSMLGGIACYHFDRPRLELCPSDDDAGPFHLPTFTEPSLRFAKLCFDCFAKLISNKDFSQRLGGSLSPPIRQRVSLLASLAGECVRRGLIINQEGQRSQEDLDFNAYTLRTLNENLSGDDEKAIGDETITAIYSLFISEVMAGTDAIIKVHINGLHSVVQRLGGLRQLLPDNELLLVVSEGVLIASVIHEVDPPAMHRDSTNLHMASLAWSTAPELPSPLLQHPVQPTIERVPDYVVNLLTEMQMLTVLLLGEEGQSNAVLNFTNDGRDSVERAKANWFRLARDECPTAANARTANEWLYEACRIAGLIYCTAVVERISLSDAGRLAATRLKTPMLVEMLCSAIYQTDLSLLWGDLAGAFVWVALVGSAAANGPEEARKQSPYLLRRWMIYPAISCANLLGTQHADLFTSSLRTMLRVQRTLRLCEQHREQ